MSNEVIVHTDGSFFPVNERHKYINGWAAVICSMDGSKQHLVSGCKVIDGLDDSLKPRYCELLAIHEGLTYLYNNPNLFSDQKYKTKIITPSLKVHMYIDCQNLLPGLLADNVIDRERYQRFDIERDLWKRITYYNNLYRVEYNVIKGHQPMSLVSNRTDPHRRMHRQLHNMVDRRSRKEQTKARRSILKGSQP